jgi:hypothetical protein
MGPSRTTGKRVWNGNRGRVDFDGDSKRENAGTRGCESEMLIICAWLRGRRTMREEIARKVTDIRFTPNGGDKRKSKKGEAVVC